jgi:hypothetical protein
MLYLGDKSIDLYSARKAAKWDILYMPNVYYLVEDKFIDFYKINRDVYVNRSYQEFFSQSGEYYDQMMILIVLAETFANMVTDVPQWYIRRDIFDLRSCKYFLESSGVDYFKIIPLKYQIRIVKNLNILIKYKSSNKNANDILDIFDVPNTRIYKYWLYKKLDSDSENGYSLEFIASDFEESYDDYIKDTKYRYSYDDITKDDKYWDGEDSHEYVKEQILNQEFTIQGTKYLSIEYQVSLRKWLYQTEYMLGLLLDTKLYDGLANITIAIPSINDTTNFRISDLFLFLVCLSNSYEIGEAEGKGENDIREPDIISDGEIPTYDENHYDWKKKYMPEMFACKQGRIHGFNSTLDKKAFIKILERRHSHLIFGSPDDIGEDALTDAEYKERADEWLAELGIFDFVVPDDSITTIDDLIGVYEINTKIYETIRSKIINADNEDDKKFYEYIYQELFTRPFDTNFYTTVKYGVPYIYPDLVQILKDRDYILYDTYNTVVNEANIETKQDLMRSIMNDTVDTLEYYLSGDGFEYLYSFVPINSFAAVTKYIYLMLSFFKSYKVYFLDPYYSLIVDDELDNSVRPVDVISEKRIINYKWDKSLVADTASGMNLDKWMVDLGESEMYEIADIYAHYDPDPLLDLDIDGTTAEKGEIEDTTNVDGGYADPMSALPYVTLNGGNSYLGMINFNNMDGGEAYEANREYYIVDGGKAHDPDVNKMDCMGSQMFNYMIDGGSAAKREFMNNSIHTKLIGTEFQMNALISTAEGNPIQVVSDGLFVDINSFGSQAEFDNTVHTLIDLANQIYIGNNTIDEDIAVIADKDLRLSRIRRILNSIIINMLEVNYLMKDNHFINMVYNEIDAVISVFDSHYTTEDSTNPYIWQDL